MQATRVASVSGVKWGDARTARDYRAEQSFGDLDDFEKWRVSRYLDGYMSMSEQDYLVISQINGTKSSDAAFADDMREYMMLPMYRDYWLRSQARHGAEFQRFINEILAELDSNNTK